jgi:CRP-like cAMP-binding protein
VPVTVTAKTPIGFFVITSPSVFSLLDEQPAIEREVLRSLARRLIPMDEGPTV